MKQYLAVTEIINWQHPKILQLAHELSQGMDNPEAIAQRLAKSEIVHSYGKIAKACFKWVRDRIFHSSDYKINPVTCAASEVLEHKTGYCYAKSHLLAALLRANSIPAGFCYQRLSVFDNGTPYCLHGLNGVYLPEHGWYRIDGRGNKIGVNAQFTPSQEQLAFSLNFPQEIDCKTIFAEPLPIIIQALQTHNKWDDLLANLPDVESL